MKPTFCFTSDFEGASPRAVSRLLNIYYKSEIPVTLFLGLNDKESYMENLPLIAPAKGRCLHHEIAIHPDYQSTMDYTYTITKTHAKWSDAMGVRAHGLLVFTNLMEMYEKAGLLYDSSELMPNVESSPFLRRKNLVELPIFFEDDFQMAMDEPMDISYLHFHNGIHVFNFHPIHVYQEPSVGELLEDLILYAKKHTEILTCRQIAMKVLNKRIETKVLR